MVQNLPLDSHGLTSMTAVSRTTGKPLGMLRVIQSFDNGMTRESSDLFAGANANAWNSAPGAFTPDLTITTKERKPFLYTLAGMDVTENVAETSGSISTIANKNGTTAAGEVGVASVATSTGTIAGGAANLKDGVYVVEAASATTIEVYAVSDINITRGTDGAFQDDTLKITTGALTVVASTEVEVPGFGFGLFGGTGAIAMTSGDTATFEVRSTNEGSFIYRIPERPLPVEFGAYFYDQKQSSGNYNYDYFPRLKMTAIPAGMTSFEWSETDIVLKVLWDQDLGYSHQRLNLATDLS